MANKRKTTTAIVAGVTAAALLLGGTFAWVSISQQAKNEAAGIVNVGGRLHDDFDGKNKDVYVENFTDPYNGGQPIYARIRLDEYMEVGSEAGKLDENGNYAADRNAVSVVADATIDDVDSWSTHKPQENCAECVENGTLCKFHEHWKWEMGGSTTFMPTFNKDKDSLDADVNGTYHGTNAADKIYYDDYVEYTTDANSTDKVYSKTDTAYYDNDPDKEKNEVEGQYTTKKETHYAKTTATSTVITMAQWIADGSQPGDYWVYDTDGWAYWANPIMPGEATGLLLSNIDMFKNPGEKCYYAINVVGQFATVGDWELFGVDETDEDYPSADAINLLTKASENVPTVTVTNVSGVTLVNRGDSVNFSASTVVGNAVSTLAEDEYEWVVLDENRNIITSSTVKDNGDGTATLTVGNEEFSAGLYVAARSKNHSGAVGLSAVAVQLYTVNISADTAVVKAGRTLQLSATVVDNGTGALETSGVKWEVSGQGENTATNITEDGILTIDENEAGATVLTVTATSNNGGFVGTYTVTVADKYTIDVTAASETVDVGYSLDLSAAVTKNGVADATSAVTWSVKGGNTAEISKDGVLTVSVDEAHNTPLTVTATSVADNEVSDTFTVTVYNGYELLKTTATAGSLETVRIDNMEWYVLKKENGKALIWASQVIPGWVNSFTPTADTRGTWKDSLVREYLNGDYYDTLNVLKNYVQETDISTAELYDRSSANYVDTTDNIFLLTEADVFGTANGSATDTTSEYTLGVAEVIVKDEMRYAEDDSWLRSPGRDSTSFARVLAGGGRGFFEWYTMLRPAMWVSIDGDSWTDGDFTVAGVTVTDDTVTLAPGENVTFTYSGSLEVVEFTVDVLNAEDTYVSGVSHGLTYASTGENTWTVTHSCTDTCSCPDGYYYKVAVNDGNKAAICDLKIYT